MPAQIRPLLQKCLAKDPRQRLRDIGDFAHLLVTDVPAAAVTLRASRPYTWIALTAILSLSLAVVALLYFNRPRSEPPRLMRLEIPNPHQVAFIAISPDGSNIALVRNDSGSRRLYLRSIDTTEWKPVPASDGASFPFWSPDSRDLAFFGAGQLKRFTLGGNRTRDICPAPTGRGGTWGDNGIVLAPDESGGLDRVDADGGKPQHLPLAIESQGVSLRFPASIPGTHKVFFTAVHGRINGGVYAADLDGGNPTLLLPDTNTSVQYFVHQGHGFVLYRRDDTLLARPFDPARLRFTGEPVSIAEGVGRGGILGFGNFSVSSAGVLVHTGAAVLNQQLAWFDRSGHLTGKVGSEGPFTGFALSRDEKRVALDYAESETRYYIWILELAGGVFSRFSFVYSRYPVWFPGDGRLLSASRIPAEFLQVKALAGGVEEKLTPPTDRVNFASYDISPDGKLAVFSSSGGVTNDDLFLLPLEGDHTPRPFATTPGREMMGQFSPDGRWLAYQSDESGSMEIYVQPVAQTGAKWQVSLAGGGQPRWSRDGRELYFISRDGKLTAVSITPGQSFQHGPPQELFPCDCAATDRGFTYQPASGGRFLALIPGAGAAEAGALMVELNWQGKLQK